MRHFLKTILFFLSSVLLQSFTEETKRFEDYFTKLQHYSLRNGVQVNFIPDKTAPIFYAVTTVLVGSVDEPYHQKGIAHFLEHLAFKGTKTVGTKDWESEKGLLEKAWELERLQLLKKISEEKRQELQNVRKQLRDLWKTEEFQSLLADLGGVKINATTSSDFTNYFGKFPAESFKKWAQLEIDRLLNIVPRQFYEEMRVIFQERKMRVDGDPLGRLYEFLLSKAFGLHPYGYPTIGYKEHLLNLTPYDLLKFHERFYRGSNITITLIGALNREDLNYLFSLAEKIPTGERNTQFLNASAVQPGVYRRKFGTKMVSVSFYKDVYPSEEDLCVTLVCKYLFESKQSPIYRALVEELKVASGVSFIEGPGYRSRNLAIVLFPYLSGVNPEKILDNFWRVLEDTKKSGLGEREVELAKTLILRQGADIFENKLQLAEWIGESSLLYGSPWEPVKIIKKLLEFSPQSINYCLQSVFHKKNSLVIVSN